MKYALHFVLITLLIVPVLTFGQTRTIGFYNVENLFDTLDHPTNNDEEFLPSGSYEWNSARYWEKIAHINQVMDSLSSPMLLGMCEIENAEVVKDVIRFGKYAQYDLIHYESTDQRGIDNALIYDPRVLTKKSSGIIRFEMPAPDSPTRDIIWAKFAVKNSKDSILAMVNHWPSRRGGEEESEPKRMIAAEAAKSFIDSVLTANKKMKIVFMGDLNDYPTNAGPMLIAESLQPMITQESGEFCGSHSYRGEWNVLDHILVSKSMLKGKTKSKKNSGKIYSNTFLLDEYKGDIVPFRTYGGKTYLGGYSDHLPVTISVRVK